MDNIPALQYKNTPITIGVFLARAVGIEPTMMVFETIVMPLHQARRVVLCTVDYTQHEGDWQDIAVPVTKSHKKRLL